MTKTLMRPWFRLARHDVRSTVPAAIRAMMQNGVLDRVFQEALRPEFIYPAIADAEPWQGGMGDTKTFTRKGLMAPVTTPITGSDPTPATYSIEQWSVTMDQYGNSADTNMLNSSMALANKYLADVQTLAVNAGQSLNQIARNKLYTAYSGGRTWVTTAGSSDTSMVVSDVSGFTQTLVNGVLTPVSGANPLSVTIAGTGNTVTGVNTGTKTLTLGTARTDVVGDSVVAANAPVSIRATGSSAYDLATNNIATFAMFRGAVTRLRRMNVPTVNGYYVAHIDPETESQLYADADFKQALTGRVDSDIYRDLSIGRFGGIDWVRNNEAPTIQAGSTGNVTIRRPIVLGAGALIAAPFESMGDLLRGTGVEDVPEIGMITVAPGVEVARIVRPPQDRLQQTLATSWSWVGDYGVPSDATNGDAALYKRAVVLEHA
ncbi:hypothetical protein OOK06_36565 [Streptomyces sp. NBC_00340]|uniref:hypothetical protein n=1 Tax=Streptomyces sp. NBC_00340 TaxID=2975716 RepID=UPI00224E3F8F|nr:hypothetical protein [Streptomyces sp. NBC_00340]MCX5137584.1 hypothetical protein [Streptomyces sp. NBC_00340]